jgi:site-specific recombinase XerD
MNCAMPEAPFGLTARALKRLSCQITRAKNSTGIAAMPVESTLRASHSPHCAEPQSPYVFISERRATLSAAGYQRMVARADVAAKFSFPVHSHMLRHACGFKLANDGHDTRAIQAYLGQHSIMSTVRYTALTPNQFKDFWKD